MRRFVTLIIFVILSLHAISQQLPAVIPDSIRTALANTKDDTARINLVLKFSRNAPCKDSSLSIVMAKYALGLAEKSAWQKGELSALMNLGRIYQECGIDYPEALLYYSRSIALAKVMGDSISQSYVNSFIGRIYESMNRHDSALAYYNKSLELNKDPRSQTNALANSGIVYNNIGDYPHSLQCYERALKLTEGLLSSAGKNGRDSLTYVGLLLTIGDVYVSMSQYDNALGKYHTALGIAGALKSKYIEMWALTEIGKVYTIKKDFAKAIQCYEKSLEAGTQNEHYYKAINLNELGNVYMETGDLVKALSYAKQSQEILEIHNELQQMPKTYTTLGKIYTRMKDNKSAVTHLLKALSICEKTGAIDDAKDAWEALSNTYGQIGQTDKAYDAFKHFIVLRDSVYNIDKAKELVRIDMQSEFGRKQYEDSMRQYEANKEFKFRLQRQRAFTYGGFAGLVLVLMLSFFIYKSYSQQKNANKIISKANITIQQEKQVSENLLLNILPEEVAQELKSAGKVQAKLYDHVTVLFTDFVNFTQASERLSPQLLVAELDTCFQAFDNILGKYNIEKIKTVGDAYLAVAGLPLANANHATDMVTAAIEIRDFMMDRKQKLGDNTFSVRIGINSGSVVAGIVGSKKFAYDIWGDTVNTASRMEQYSYPSKINISESTYQLLNGKFSCEYRGKIPAKNKGEIDMYFVK